MYLVGTQGRIPNPGKSGVPRSPTKSAILHLSRMLHGCRSSAISVCERAGQGKVDLGHAHTQCSHAGT